MTVHAAPRAEAPATAPPLILMFARSSTEEVLIRHWARENYPEAEPLHARADELHWVSFDDAQLVVPVRVVWTPREGSGRRPRLSDVMALPVQRRPWPVLHPALLRRRRDAATVVAGDAASIGALRSAFATEAAGGREDLADFVVRRAVLACERAERQLVGDRYKVPRLMVEQIIAGSSFRGRAATAARRLGMAEQEFLARAKANLDEMVAVMSPPAIDAFRAITSPFHARAWSVGVDTEGMEHLRELNRTAPLVFLPSHRSYSDPLVLAEVLHAHDFPRNHVLGGDNMSFWPVGSIGKRAGVVFIRRSFGDDEVYKFAIREYLGHLMAKRFNLEWYIEGGRTRTGKLRRPRFGLLRYLVDAMESDAGRDAVLVPVSIIYDQLHEVGAMAAQQVGAAKPAEGMRWLARYIRDQRRHIGEARVRFGEPFSLRESLAEAGPGPAQLEKVAFRICAGINRATPVMATSVVTFALLDTGGRAVTFAQVAAVAAPLLDYLGARGTIESVAELRQPNGLRQTLGRLTEVGVVSCYDGGREPVWSIPVSRAHVAAFYRNGAVHHLVNRAIVEMALLSVDRDTEEGDPRARGWERALAIRDLLKFEFFFPSKREFYGQLAHELDLIEPAWREGETSSAGDLLTGCRTVVAPRVVRSVFDAQLVVAEQLLERDRAEVSDRSAFLARCLTVGRQMHLQGRVAADSVSRELYDSALRLAENRSLVAPVSLDVAGPRRAFRDEILDVLDVLDRGAVRDGILLQKVLGHGVRFG
jgi:glycerol-3-phosphate O-acyltransferase